MERTLLGLMSGTSLDGLDLCLVRFHDRSFEILEAETIPYPDLWRNKLKEAPTLSGEDLCHLHGAYGYYLGELCRDFLKKKRKTADAIASHGHTIFHQPDKHFTFQLGDGAYICAKTRIDCIYDFRKLDVALFGQGAPLVPIGDQLLFPQYTYCLNLGGFSNISTLTDGKRSAYDICACNIVLNEIARDLPGGYDKDGMNARKGHIHTALLQELNALGFYHTQGAKSLGREWVEEVVFPLLSTSGLSQDDLLATYTEHAAEQIGKSMTKSGSCLTTGGGAWNSFLTERIQAHTQTCLVLPQPQIIDFKEALIFAYLGYLYLEKRTNTLSSVTGAECDSIGGILCKAPR